VTAVTIVMAATAVTAGMAVAAPGPAGAQVSYGLGDAQGQFAHYYANPWFKALTRPASVHRITYVRFFVAYDAVAQWNGSTTAPGCVDSRVQSQPWVDPAGRSYAAGQSWDDLVTSLEAAFAERSDPRRLDQRVRTFGDPLLGPGGA
jgi:hypothetical protein